MGGVCYHCGVSPDSAFPLFNRRVPVNIIYDTKLLANFILTMTFFLSFLLVSFALKMSYRIIDNPDLADAAKCCCQTTDNIFYEVPKDYFRYNENLTRRKVNSREAFAVPINKDVFERLLVILEKMAVLSVKVVENDSTEDLSFMDALDKRQVKFVRKCLNISIWDGQSVAFYGEAAPKIDDVVWIKVAQVHDTSATVHLLEYGNCEGNIPYTEVTRRRVRSIGKFIKVNKTEAAQVIRVDKNKGYIDLSKKQVTPAEARACEMRFRRGSHVRSIVCFVAEQCGKSPQEAMEMIAYPLYQRDPKIDAYGWLKQLNESKDVEGILGPLNLPADVSECLLTTIQKSLRLRVLTIAAQIDVTCPAADGVNHIRDVLLLGRDFGKGKEPEINISVLITGPPLYDLRIRTDLKEEGMLLMQEALDKMKIEMATRGGTLKVCKEPYIVGEEDGGAKNDGENFEDEEDDAE